MDDIRQKLDNDLLAIHEDWKRAASEQDIAENREFLMQFALNIILLHHDANLACESELHHDKGELIAHLLSTPWGAPFISDQTLIEAAQRYRVREGNSSEFPQIVKTFVRFEKEFSTQVFDILDRMCSDGTHDTNR